MSAADLFINSEDACFRLHGTYIVIGKMMAKIYEVCPGDDFSAEQARLTLVIGKDGNIWKDVRLGLLPLSAMFACPVGYIGEAWVSRGPARHRYQGLLASSFWFKSESEGLHQNGQHHPSDILPKLLAQPSRREGLVKAGRPVTNKIFVTKEKGVLSKGDLIGEYAGKSRLKLLPGVPYRRIKHELDAAGLTVIS